ncbi:MAG TPA: hypothetical protein VFP68_08390, partial [Burkholderiaceae bacterium]|nr:hypothetical protein [Burkholderiaceae bacterium]
MKQFFVRRLQMAPALTLFLVGCASTPLPPDPILPPALRPPEGQVLSQVLNAQGVQIYECTASTERPGTYDWS